MVRYSYRIFFFSSCSFFFFLSFIFFFQFSVFQFFFWLTFLSFLNYRKKPKNQLISRQKAQNSVQFFFCYAFLVCFFWLFQLFFLFFFYTLKILTLLTMVSMSLPFTSFIYFTSNIECPMCITASTEMLSLVKNCPSLNFFPYTGYSYSTKEYGTLYG